MHPVDENEQYLLRQAESRRRLLSKYPDDPEYLTQTQKEILTGSMLGDGYFGKGDYFPNYSVERSAGDLQYLQWNYEHFKQYCLSPIKERHRYDRRTKKTYHMASFHTRTMVNLKRWEQTWYPIVDGKRKKILPIKNLLITPLSLAVWFCDDGHIRKASKATTPHCLRLTFSTQCFEEDSVDALAQLLTERYGHPFRTYTGNGGRLIEAANKPARAFAEDIDAVLPPGMERKAYWRRHEAQVPH